jgi:hypothetical protein
VEIDERLLYRIQVGIPAKSLDGDHVTAIRLKNEQDAGAEGVVSEGVAACPAEEDGARSAITL